MGLRVGTICLLAKALGIGSVIYSDVYDLSCRDPSILGRALALEADHYVTGELAEVISYMKANNLSCDVLASHGCIEHIYDIEQFYKHIPEIPAARLQFWPSTGANPLRPRTKRLLSQVAVRAEQQRRGKKWGHKERDAVESFKQIRTAIIRDEGERLTTEEISILTTKTRGLREDDVRKTVRAYLQSGRMPPDPEHPTNTCDRWTGNWAERLMDPFYLSSLLCRNGLTAEVAPLYWPKDTRSTLRGSAKAGMNLFMSYFPKHGLRPSPGCVRFEASVR